jgi:hypothetical protein
VYLAFEAASVAASFYFEKCRARWADRVGSCLDARHRVADGGPRERGEDRSEQAVLY